MILKAEIVYKVIESLSFEEKNRLFLMLEILSKTKIVKKEFDLTSEELAKIILEKHRKKWIVKKENDKFHEVRLRNPKDEGNISLFKS